MFTPIKQEHLKRPTCIWMFKKLAGKLYAYSLDYSHGSLTVSFAYHSNQFAFQIRVGVVDAWVHHWLHSLIPSKWFELNSKPGKENAMFLRSLPPYNGEGQYSLNTQFSFEILVIVLIREFCNHQSLMLVHVVKHHLWILKAALARKSNINLWANIQFENDLPG